MRVRRTGKSYAHPLIILIASPNERSNSRFGISASKAVGGAVSRNRAKRRIRAAIQSCLAAVKDGWDILLIARAPLLKAEWPQVCEAVHAVLKRAHLLDDI
jgi:ribonuclease P protein component